MRILVSTPAPFPMPPVRRQRSLPSTPAPPAEWRSRGYLPHFDRPGLIQAITFRLHDSIPACLLAAWRDELEIATASPDSQRRQADLRKRVARHEDAGQGACFLRDPSIAAIVENALLHFDGVNYRLLAWCIMPNHVHALVELDESRQLAAIIHSWKSFTASQANKLLQRSGPFWFREYHDRFIRDESHFMSAVHYIEMNPVKARLVKTPERWRFSSAARRQ